MKIRRNHVIVIFIVVFGLFALSGNVTPKSPPNVNDNMGQDVTLPCHIPLGIQPQNVDIQWKKRFDDHMEDMYKFTTLTGHEIFAQGYQDRITFSKEGLVTRNVSLKLKGVHVADEGDYVCIVKSSYGNSTTQIVLRVASVKDHNGSDGSLWFWVFLVVAIAAQGGTILYFKYKEKKPPTKRSEEFVLLNPEEQGESEHVREENEKLQAENEQINEENEHLKTGNANVILNRETAHPRLEVSEDGKCVRDTGCVLKIPNSTERFDSHMFVLAKEGFDKGKHYWEVEVGQKKSWDLGVASESISRKGKITLAPQNGYWVIGLDGKKDYWARTDPWTRLKVSGNPTKIGIYLDMSASRYSLFFHDVDRKKLMYIFTIHCSGKLWPFFSTGSVAAKLDDQPLKIVL